MPFNNSFVLKTGNPKRDKINPDKLQMITYFKPKKLSLIVCLTYLKGAIGCILPQGVEGQSRYELH
jgi:hypothetical protein